MTATNLPPIANLTGSSVTEAGFKAELTNLLASLRERGDPLGAFGYLQNLGLAFSVGSGALTCALKQRDGATDAASTNVVAVPFRNATASNGGFIVRDIAAALSLTVASGATLGHSSGVAANAFWYLLDNSGTVELAVSSKFFGWSGIVSTTAMSGSATSATAMYSSSARTNVPYLCIGKTVDTQTTAGSWAAVPTAVYLAPFDLLDQATTYPGAEGTIASASTTDLGSAGVYMLGITGTTTITAFGSSATTANPLYFLRFAGALTLTHNGTSLILPGAANITTAAGDTCIAQYLGSGNWRVRQYTVAAASLAAGSSGTQHAQAFASSGTFTAPAGTVSGTAFKFTITGAGAGAGNGGGSNTGGGGGAAGATCVAVVTGLSAGSGYTVTVGAGGANGTTGSTGGTSSVVVGATTYGAAGGTGGKTNGDGGSGGAATNGTTNATGGDGAPGTTAATSAGCGGSGGASFWGGGGKGGNSAATGAGSSGSAYGSGGGGGAVGATGGSGAGGYVLVEWVL